MIFIIQALDGFNRSAHLLPKHLLGPFLRSVNTFSASDRIKGGDSIRLTAILVNLSAILQPPFERPSLPPQETNAHAALVDVIPDLG